MTAERDALTDALREANGGPEPGTYTDRVIAALAARGVRLVVYPPAVPDRVLAALAARGVPRGRCPENEGAARHGERCRTYTEGFDMQYRRCLGVEGHAGPHQYDT